MSVDDAGAIGNAVVTARGGINQAAVDRFDIYPLTDNDYCIAGSEIGRKHVVDIIKRLSEAASSQEIMAPV